MISVIIPLYNKEGYIHRAIQSVLHQTYKEFELIIIDDGSTDSGPELVKTILDPRIRFFHQENNGVSVARNQGIALAEGELVAFLDADDEWLDNHLQIIMNMYMDYPSAGAYTTSYLICRPNGRKEYPNYLYLPKNPYIGPIPHYFLSATGHDIPVNSSVVAIQKHVFLTLGGFIEGEKWGEDTEMWGRIALHFDIIISSEVGAIWHQEAKNRTSHILPELRLEPVYYLIKAAEKKGTIPLAIKEDVFEYKAKKELEYVEQAIYRNAYKDAQLILNRVKTKKFLREKLFWIFIVHSPRSLYLLLKDIKRKVSILFFNESYDKDPWQ